MQTVKFNAQLLAAVSPCISKEETRYYLTGIYFEPHPNGGAYAVATDGHALACAHDPDGVAPEGGVILPMGKNILRDCKSKRTDSADRFFAWDNETGLSTVTQGDLGDKPFAMEPAQAIDGTFPDWRRVVPVTKDTTASAHMTYGAAQLKRLQDVATALGDKNTPLSFFAEDATSPAIVRFGNHNDIFAVQMPMRPSIEGPALPEFYRDELYGTKPAED